MIIVFIYSTFRERIKNAFLMLLKSEYSQLISENELNILTVLSSPF